jgi:acetylornithine deacetylase
MSERKSGMEIKEARQRVHRIIDSRKEELVKTLSALVGIPTITGQETEGQKYISELYSKLGLKVVSLEADYEKVSKHRAFVESGLDLKGRPNIIGILEGEPSAKSLILNGHIDVVSPEPIEQWDSSPWEARIEDDKMYGRGAADMKCGLVASYFALKAILEAGLKPEGTVMLQSVIEEELGGGGGTLACLLEGFTADGLVIPEPCKGITLAHPGINYFRVRVTGKSAHAGLAHMGVNAIGKMNKVYDALMAYGDKRTREVHYPLFDKASAMFDKDSGGVSCHLNIGTYKAGDWVSSVAGWAEMGCRISYIPGETFEEIKQQVEQVISDTANRDEWMRQHPPEVSWFGWKADPWEQDPNDPLVVSFKACTEEVLGREIEIIGITAGQDNRFGQYFGIPSVSYGPSGGNFHGINEYVEIPSVIDCTKILASFIIEWCGT